MGPPKNSSPTIEFLFNKLAVDRSSDVMLIVTVSDADDDPLSVAWASNTGVLNPSQQGDTLMTWSAPAAPGSDVITATVTDGKGGSATAQKSLKIGTPQTANINIDQSWRFSDSPHILRPPTGTLGIAAKLTIEAGVEVLIDRVGAEIQVDSTLRISGTSMQPVTIMPNTDDADEGFWKGISAKVQISTAPVLDFDYAHIFNAITAVNVIDGSATLTGCNIKFSSTSAIQHQSSGALVVENCSITNNLGSGIEIGSFFNLPDSVIIRGDSIAANGKFEGGIDPIYSNGEAGVSISLNDPSGFVPITITGNEISRNEFPGIRLGDWNNNLSKPVFPLINGNSIFGNEFSNSVTKLNLRIEHPFNTGALPTIDARSNFWGAVDTTVVRASIRDWYQNPGGMIAVKVRIDPILTSRP